MGVLKVWDGTAWQFISAASDGASVYVGPEAPAGTPDTGDMWFDSDQDGTTGTTLPLTIANGGTGATAAASARSSLAVPSIGSSTSTAGAPSSGTWARGDQWLDSNNVVWTCTTAGTPGTWIPPIGYEYVYNEITGGVAVSATTEATANVVITASAFTFDGVTSAVIEFYVPQLSPPTTATNYMIIWLYQDGASTGAIGLVQNPAAAAAAMPVLLRRKMTPTPGSHVYSIRASTNAGTGNIYTTNAAANGKPGYVRITRA